MQSAHKTKTFSFAIMIKDAVTGGSFTENIETTNTIQAATDV